MPQMQIDHVRGKFAMPIKNLFSATICLFVLWSENAFSK